MHFNRVSHSGSALCTSLFIHKSWFSLHCHFYFILHLFYYHLQRSCSKVIFSQASVILVHIGGRGCVADTPQQTPRTDTSLPSACWDTHPPPSVQCMLGYMPLPPRQPLQLMVRIMECILVLFYIWLLK